MIKPLPFTWDMHVCAPRRPGSDLVPALEEYRSAGVAMVAVNVSDAGYTLEQAMRVIASFRAQIAEHGEALAFVQEPGDIVEAQRLGRLGVCFDVEGALLLGEQVDAARLLYDLGVRWMAFAYNRANAFGAGCHEAIDEGLTPLGRELARTMDEIGMIKCCSHTGYRTARDVLDVSTRPCIFSHSNPRALVDHPRNVPDDLMKALAQTGGVIGITGVGLFLGKKNPTVADVFRHVDYAVNVIGAEHVGLGLDHSIDAGYDLVEYISNKTYWPAGHGYDDGRVVILGPEIFAPLADRMHSAGYPEAAIRGILGENFRRVATQVWRPPTLSRATTGA
ncbi:MAG: dipeptidase [Vulcanimicrobiaceae bacterium]